MCSQRQAAQQRYGCTASAGARSPSHRTSEKNLYTQVRETFAQCAIDYDKDDAAARTFFATSQDARFVSRLRSRRGGSVGQPSGCDWRATCLSRTVTDLA
ncbi:MAG: virulence RhuM family protein [Aquamicrobium sp.]|nr:virulence RhuM family protein [Aquamicrobium sp.]